MALSYLGQIAAAQLLPIQNGLEVYEISTDLDLFQNVLFLDSVHARSSNPLTLGWPRLSYLTVR